MKLENCIFPDSVRKQIQEWIIKELEYFMEMGQEDNSALVEDQVQVMKNGKLCICIQRRINAILHVKRLEVPEGNWKFKTEGGK